MTSVIVHETRQNNGHYKTLFNKLIVLHDFCHYTLVFILKTITLIDWSTSMDWYLGVRNEIATCLWTFVCWKSPYPSQTTFPSLSSKNLTDISSLATWKKRRKVLHLFSFQLIFLKKIIPFRKEESFLCLRQLYMMHHLAYI